MAEESSNLPDDEYFEGIRVCHRMIQVNGIALHIAQAGSGPLLVLLHGFPENWRAWVRQFPGLVKSGYRVVAPDLRGYNLSDKPSGVRVYRLDVLSRDICELILALGESAASIVGHDWGGVVAFNLAIAYPAKVSKLIVINAPHPSRYIQLLWRSRQFFKSWYVFFFLCPFLPEAIIRWNGFERVRVLFRQHPTRPDVYTSDQVDDYIKGFSRPSALSTDSGYQLLSGGYMVWFRNYQKSLECCCFSDPAHLG